MIFYAVPAELDDPGFREAVWQQNPAFQAAIPQVEFIRDFSPKFRIGDREATQIKWVVAVTPKIRSALLKMKRVYVGWFRCRKQDFHSVTRCFRCLGLGQWQNIVELPRSADTV